jgi:hypothetical protein
VLAEIAEGVMRIRHERVADGSTSPRAADQEWIADQRRTIDEANRRAAGLSGDELRKQRRRIAALKRNLTLGRDGLRRAGDEAALARWNAEREWIALRQWLIEEAEEVARGLVGPERKSQRRRIAALKRTLSLGRTGLAGAGRRAAITRNARGKRNTVFDP